MGGNSELAMDFIKSLLPPLRMPKLKHFKRWNGGSILNLSQLSSLASRSRNVGTVASAVVGPASSSSSFTIRGTKKQPPETTRLRRSEISTVSGSLRLPSPLPAPGGSVGSKSVGGGGYGLYALKCDRSAAKRGILLSLPRKLSGSYYQPSPEGMVHEKFSPCKRSCETVEPPPRLKRFRRRQMQQQQQQRELEQEARVRSSTGSIYYGDRLLERNRSELFRIAERGSNEHLDARSRAELPPPAARRLAGHRRARSVENILTIRSCCPRVAATASVETDSESDRQVSSLRMERTGRGRGWKKQTQAKPRLKYSESVESDAEEVKGRRPPPMKSALRKASDFSIDNDSDEIEVRFQNSGSTESEEISYQAPLPERVETLRRESVEKQVKVKPEVPPQPKKPIEQSVISKEPVASFKPLAEVLQESLKSSDLKRKWINDLLTDSDEETVQQTAKRQQSTESLTKRFELVAKFDRQLEALEADQNLDSQESTDSINIFKKPNNDFEEFDKLFEGDRPSLQSIGSVKKSVTMNDHITYINRKSNRRYSFSSIESDDKPASPPPPPPPPPPPFPSLPLYSCLTSSRQQPKSTVNIQDYYEKQQLQRVRYVSAPSPSPSQLADDSSITPASAAETLVTGGQEEPLHEAVNNNIVLPLHLVNSTDDDGNTSSEIYNQTRNDHIPCNINLTNINTTPKSLGYRNGNGGGGGVFIVGETLKRTAGTTALVTPPDVARQPVRRYVNYKFDDYCRVINNSNNNSKSSPSSGSQRVDGGRKRVPPRKFNINDFQDKYYNEEGVVII